MVGKPLAQVPRAIVAIPVKDEASRIGRCLGALASQVDPSGATIAEGSFGVMLLLNNCQDDTANAVSGLMAALPFPIRVWEHDLPPGSQHAGAARRLAMDAAAAWLAESDNSKGAILTTDADTQVAPDWIARQLVGFASGIDAIAGHILEDPEEFRRLPMALRQREQMERRYDQLLAEIEWHLDPIADDPWPRHRMVAGASFGVTLDAYLAVGRLPLQPTGEDRALGRKLLLHDRRLRHAPDVTVTTSCRLLGRAAGGMADTLRHRLRNPDSPCDERLEPLLDVVHRAFWRATLRQQHALGDLGDLDFWAPALRIDRDAAASIADMPQFGRIWATVERLSPSLGYRPLLPGALPMQLRRARGILAWLRDRGPATMLEQPAIPLAAS